MTAWRAKLHAPRPRSHARAGEGVVQPLRRRWPALEALVGVQRRELALEDLQAIVEQQL
jgi:hypothetical protein